MRTIKFRGKHTETGKWLFGMLADTDVIKPSYVDIDSLDGKTYLYTVSSDTIGQFTGLFDRTGKEIYEGDIISSDGISEYDLMEVRFVRGVFAFLWNGNLDDECATQAPTQEWAEVIGNIHDNPKMLTRYLSKKLLYGNKQSK